MDAHTERTFPLTWLALAACFSAVVYAPLLVGVRTSNWLIKLGLIRSIPIAALIAVIYAIGVATLQKKNPGRVAASVIATIAVGIVGLLLDGGAWILAFNCHGP
jgi:hypothetical protein